MADRNQKEKRRKQVIDVLNQARGMELQATGQYMIQHYRLEAMDYGKLASKLKKIAIDEMRHAEAFAERIIELGGEPSTSLAGKIVKGQSVEDMFPFNAEQEEEAIAVYNQFLVICRENLDSVTARILARAIDDEQAHLTDFQNIGEHIRRLGDRYLARLAGT
jgi:bacterioferritin